MSPIPPQPTSGNLAQNPGPTMKPQRRRPKKTVSPKRSRERQAHLYSPGALSRRKSTLALADPLM